MRYQFCHILFKMLFFEISYPRHRASVSFILTLWIIERHVFELTAELLTSTAPTELEPSLLWWGIWTVLISLERLCQSSFLKNKTKTCSIRTVSSFRAPVKKKMAPFIWASTSQHLWLPQVMATPTGWGWGRQVAKFWMLISEQCAMGHNYSCAIDSQSVV